MEIISNRTGEVETRPGDHNSKPIKHSRGGRWVDRVDMRNYHNDIGGRPGQWWESGSYVTDETTGRGEIGHGSLEYYE